MFESLQDKLGSIFKKLRGAGKLSEKDVDVALREVRIVLLEADVNLKVVREFISRVREKVVGEQVWNSLTPGQLVIKFVKDELTEIMGGSNVGVTLPSKPPAVIMLAGLNGAGKTTSAGKLALYFKDRGHTPLLVAADLYRPAAADQLKILGDKISIPVYSDKNETDPVKVCRSGIDHARSNGRDVVILDTAGRLHIDEELMQELERVSKEISPDETLLAVDAMTGQDAVNIASTFNERIGVDGVILTKLDGDARGGAAFSIKYVTGKPIKFIGMGEKIEALEPFHPDRIVSRILGMGDVLGLIEKAESAYTDEQARELEKKFRKKEFSLQDFLDQIRQIRKMGPIRQIMEMIPGFSNLMKDMPIDEKQIGRVEAIICSMTPKERRDPSIFNASRKRRVAAGSGVEVADVNRLLKQYDMSKKMFKQFADFDKMKKNMPFRLPF